MVTEDLIKMEGETFNGKDLPWQRDIREIKKGTTGDGTEISRQAPGRPTLW